MLVILRTNFMESGIVVVNTENIIDHCFKKIS